MRSTRSATTRRNENILAWLTNCPELPENIRFVLTSRPDNEALKLFRDKQADRLARLEIAKEDRNVRQDVQAFVAKLIGEPAVPQVLKDAADGANAFAEMAVDRQPGLGEHAQERVSPILQLGFTPVESWNSRSSTRFILIAAVDWR